MHYLAINAVGDNELYSIMPNTVHNNIYWRLTESQMNVTMPTIRTLITGLFTEEINKRKYRRHR